MRFYLDEAFRRSPGIRVFNDVSFEDSGVRHQIDHLLLHAHSLFIVESKSVSTEVEVNERNEWSRLWNRKWQGIPSPVEQAKRQAAALRQHLNDHSETLSATGRPDRFKAMPIATFVAISDHGRWSHSGKAPIVALPVYKADLITDIIKTEVVRHERAKKVFAKPDGTYGLFRFKAESFERVATHLGALSDAAAAQSVEPVSAERLITSVVETRSTEVQPFRCKKCQSGNGKAKPGRFGPFFVCLYCQQNNAVPKKCGRCNTGTSTKIVNGSIHSACEECGFLTIVSVAPNPTASGVA